MMAKPKILLSGLAFAEGPRWHEGKLWFSDMHGRRVMTVELKGRSQVITEVPGKPSGLGWTPDGRLLIVSMRDRRLLRLDATGLACVADLSSLASGDCNDMVVDRIGRAYIGNFGLNTSLVKNYAIGPAEIIMVNADGKVRTVADNMTFPNGMVITPDDKSLIVAETFAHRLTAFDVQPDGSLTGRRVWASLPVDIFPDGICLDAEKGVWAANAGGRNIVRVKEGGEITHRIKLVHHSYACMLGGPDRRTLFILTSEDSDAAVCREKLSSCICILRVDIPGAGLP